METKKEKREEVTSASTQKEAAKKFIEAFNRSRKASFIKSAERVLYNN